MNTVGDFLKAWYYLFLPGPDMPVEVSAVGSHEPYVAGHGIANRHAYPPYPTFCLIDLIVDVLLCRQTQLGHQWAVGRHHYPVFYREGADFDGSEQVLELLSAHGDLLF